MDLQHISLFHRTALLSCCTWTIAAFFSSDLPRRFGQDRIRLFPQYYLLMNKPIAAGQGRFPVSQPGRPRVVYMNLVNHGSLDTLSRFMASSWGFY